MIRVRVSWASSLLHRHKRSGEQQPECLTRYLSQWGEIARWCCAIRSLISQKSSSNSRLEQWPESWIDQRTKSRGRNLVVIPYSAKGHTVTSSSRQIFYKGKSNCWKRETIPLTRCVTPVEVSNLTVIWFLFRKQHINTYNALRIP